MNWFIYFKRHIQDSKVDSYRIIQRIAIQELSKRFLKPQAKKDALSQLLLLVKKLEGKRVIIKDYEIYGYALIRYILNERGRIQGIPQEHRKKVTKALNRLKTVI